jgi:hypothetical protein
MSKIFVETRGTSRGYEWFEAENSQVKSPQIPDLVKQLADTEFESLVLYRESNKLILAITALKSSRIDNRTRPIRNSLIWIANNNEEVKIRGIIVEYLTDKNKFEQQIATAITETSEIKIDNQKLEYIGNENKLKNDFLTGDKLTLKSANLDKYKQDLIEEIKQNSLPEKEGLLILVSENKSQKTFEEFKPWRGLSDNISNSQWITFENNKSDIIKGDNAEEKKKNITTQFNLFSIILVVILVISNGFFIYQSNQLNQRINELEKKFNQIENLQSVIDKSKQDVETVKTNLENEILTAKAKFEKTFLQAQKQFNNDISSATTEYETNMNKIKQTLDDSLKKIN